MDSILITLLRSLKVSTEEIFKCVSLHWGSLPWAVNTPYVEFLFRVLISQAFYRQRNTFEVGDVYMAR